MDSLLPSPTLSTAFMKINSTLPSSAAVERLFSAAAQVIVTVTVYTELCNCLDDTRNITHSLGGDKR